MHNALIYFNYVRVFTVNVTHLRSAFPNTFLRSIIHGRQPTRARGMCITDDTRDQTIVI